MKNKIIKCSNHLLKLNKRKIQYAYQYQPFSKQESRWHHHQLRLQWHPVAGIPPQWSVSAGVKYEQIQFRNGSSGPHQSGLGSCLSSHYRGWQQPWQHCNTNQFTFTVYVKSMMQCHSFINQNAMRNIFEIKIKFCIITWYPGFPPLGLHVQLQYLQWFCFLQRWFRLL